MIAFIFAAGGGDGKRIISPAILASRNSSGTDTENREKAKIRSHNPG
jgi:hypothetical protein